MKGIDESFLHQNEGEVSFVPISSAKTSLSICLAGLRTLPSYIGPLKLELTFIDATGQNVLGKDEVMTPF